MPLIVFGIGTNLGNKKSNIIKAKFLLKKSFQNLLYSSSSFENPALVLNKSTPVFCKLSYINSAIAFNINLKPLLVLKKIKQIEKKFGRKSKIKWAPRMIDIDILIYEQNEVSLPKLQIPHPELMNRTFTLVPLIEVLDSLNINSLKYKNALNTLR